MRYKQLPWQPKLVTNAGQANLLGSQAWQLTNCRQMADGSLRKRYGQERWSKYILYKDPVDTAHKHDFATRGDWVSITDYDVEQVNSISLFEDTLRVFLESSSKNVYIAQANATVLSSENQISIRFLAKFPELPGAATSTKHLSVELAVSATQALRVSFADDGLFYWTAASTLVEIGALTFDGEWHVWEIVHTVGGTSTVYKDEASVGTIPILATFGSWTAGRLTVLGQTDTSSNRVEAYFDYIYVTSKTASGDSLWTDTAIRGLFEHRNSIQTQSRAAKRYVIAHAGTSAWADKVLDGKFVQIANGLRSSGGVPSYTVFRDSLYFTDSIDLRLWMWNTSGPAVLNQYAPPCAFLRSYAARLWTGGDPINPLRVYFSGIRNANDWTTQSSGSFLTSGFLDLEEHQGGDRLIGYAGPWNGLLICYTERTVQVIDATGGDPNTFSRRTIVYGLGAAGANTTAFSGNDAFFMSRRGIHRLSTTEKFGDIQQGYASFPVDNLWSTDSESDHYVIPSRLPFSFAASYRPAQLCLFACAMDDNDNNNFVIVYDEKNENWYLWDLDAASIVEFTSPDEYGIYLLVGDYSGYVNLMGPHIIQDNGTDFTMTVESGRIDLRDLGNPELDLRDHMKKFKTLHLHLKPENSNATTDLTVITDEDAVKTATITQDPFALKSLGPTGTFTLGTDMLRSPETVAVVDKAIDLRGKYMRFKLEQSSNDLRLLGYELDFEDEGIHRSY